MKYTIIEIVLHILAVIAMGAGLGAALIFVFDINSGRLVIISILLAVILNCASWLFDDKSEKEFEQKDKWN